MPPPDGRGSVFSSLPSPAVSEASRSATLAPVQLPHLGRWGWRLEKGTAWATRRAESVTDSGAELDTAPPPPQGSARLTS